MGPLPGVAAVGSAGGAREAGGSPHECSRPVWDFTKDLFTRAEGSQSVREKPPRSVTQAAEGAGPDGVGALRTWILPGDQGPLPGIRGAAASGQGGEVTPSKVWAAETREDGSMEMSVLRTDETGYKEQRTAAVTATHRAWSLEQLVEGLGKPAFREVEVWL